jgi:hypothetical protein
MLFSAFNRCISYVPMFHVLACHMKKKRKNDTDFKLIIEIYILVAE